MYIHTHVYIKTMIICSYYYILYYIALPQLNPHACTRNIVPAHENLKNGSLFLSKRYWKS